MILNEKEELSKILTDEEVQEIQNGDIEKVVEDCFLQLFEFYVFTTNEMPYDVAKARGGDPYKWLAERIEDVYFS